jgi:hypothetical protein
MNRPALALASLAALALAGCAASTPAPSPPAPAPTAPSPAPAAPIAAGEPAPAATVISTEILAREPVANTATVKHILISWADLSDAFQGNLDPRAAKRSKADAEAAVRSIVKQLEGGADFDAVMKEMSEDTGSARSGRAFTVTPDAQLVIEFRQLSLRLRPGEFGVCQSDFGFHIIKRFT